jgi:hypothetical protein
MIFALILGCGGPHVPEGFQTIVQVQGTSVQVGGSGVGSWESPDALADAGSAYVAALAAARGSEPDPGVVIDVPEGTMASLDALIRGAGAAGYTRIGFREPAKPKSGPAGLVRLAAPAAAPTGAITGADAFGELRILTDGASSWVEGDARFEPRREPPGKVTWHARSTDRAGLPVDCGAVYANFPALLTACDEGRSGAADAPATVPLSGAIACLVSTSASVDAASAWRTELAADLRSMDPRQEVAWAIVPGADAPAGLIVPIVQAFTDAGVQPPVWSAVMPTAGAIAPLDCTNGAVRDARGLDAAGARWLGAQP